VLGDVQGGVFDNFALLFGRQLAKPCISFGIRSLFAVTGRGLALAVAGTSTCALSTQFFGERGELIRSGHDPGIFRGAPGHREETALRV